MEWPGTTMWASPFVSSGNTREKPETVSKIQVTVPHSTATTLAVISSLKAVAEAQTILKVSR